MRRFTIILIVLSLVPEPIVTAEASSQSQPLAAPKAKMRASRKPDMFQAILVGLLAPLILADMVARESQARERLPAGPSRPLP
jgi:hypothetical protein